MDPAIVARYYQDVAGADSSIGQYIFPCSSGLPDLTFTIGGTGPVTLPGHVLNYHPLTDNPSSKLSNICPPCILFQ